MEITIPYGKGTINATLPDGFDIQFIEPQSIPAAANPKQVVQLALENPVDGIDLTQFSGATSAAIAINDKTRPVPHEHLLPPLLTALENIGIPRENITLIIATGTHPVMPPSEYSYILPDNIIEHYRITCHDAFDESNLTFLGTTSRNTPVYTNKEYLAADLRLVIGNIEPHQFMGFSGGVKSAAIGLAGFETININHAMMMNHKSRLGYYDDNPARQDVEEIGELIGVHFALNALLNNKKELVRAIAGNPKAVMETAIPQVKQGFQVSVDKPFDLIITSPGGYPKDINVYQTQKGMAHAVRVLKEGGTLIIAAACPEGTGSDHYEEWMFEKPTESFNDVFARFENEEFRIGPHKAFQIARDAHKFRVMLISEMEDSFVKRLLLEPVENIDVALADVLPTLSSDSRIGIMPIANATIPVLR